MWGHSTCSLRIVSAHSTNPCKHTHRHTHTIFESPQMQSFLLVRIRDLISTGPRQRAATVNIWFYLNYTTWDLLKPWLKHLSCKNAHSWKRTDMQSWCLCSLAVCELSYMWTCYPCETLTLIVKLITFHHFLFVKKKKICLARPVLEYVGSRRAGIWAQETVPIISECILSLLSFYLYNTNMLY